MSKSKLTYAELEHKLKCVISHASGGAIQDGASMGLNDICVQISQHHNRIWTDAQESVKKKLGVTDV